MRHTIRLDRLNRQGDTLSFEFSATLDLFRRRSFFIRYDKPVETADLAFCAVPFAAVMAPIAWASGADLVLPCLDAEYARALERCSAYWKKCYPKWRFTSRLAADLVNTQIPEGSRTGLLFSGGLDSLATYRHIQEQRPDLFVVIGADIPAAQEEFIRHCKDKLFDSFARAESLDLTYIHTDLREVLDTRKLKRYAPNWYATVQFGLMLTALVAPVGYRSLRTLAISSCSHPSKNYDYPCGGEPEVVRNIRWGRTRVEDHLHGLDRVGKAALLMTRPELLHYLRVCWVQHRKLNCGKCNKCLRTVCELLLSGADPNRANFEVNHETLRALRRTITKGYHSFFRGDQAVLDYWRQIRRDIDLGALPDRYGSREFFEWLAGYERLDAKTPTGWSRLAAYAEKAAAKLRGRSLDKT